MAQNQNQNDNKAGQNQPGQQGQLPKNAPSNQLHEGSQNKDQLNAGAGIKDNPDKEKKTPEAKNAGLNSEPSNEKNANTQPGAMGGSTNSGL